jgi:hypothetical protein
MSKALKPAASTVSGIVFELDRFELAGADRCELHGRWFGVRGRRFMRPALTVIADGRRTRLLADLTHKPWAAEDGEPWQAAFRGDLEGAELLEAELTVAPDITITLPAPEVRIGAGRKKPPATRTQPPQPRDSRRAGDRSRIGGPGVRERPELPQLKPRPPEAGAHGGERAAMTRELSEAQNEHRRLKRQLERTEAEKEHAAARIGELLGNLDQLKRDRDEAQRQRDQMAAERDAAQRASDAAIHVNEDARSARGHSLTERNAALAARDQTVSERDAALAARDHAVSERDALARTSERLRSELAAAISARGAALVMRRATQARPASRRYDGAVPLAIAIVVVLAVMLVLMIVLRVV